MHKSDAATRSPTGLTDTVRPTVALRPMQAGDEAAVRRLWQRFSKPTEESSADWIRRAIDHDDGYVFGVVAVDDQQVVGFGLLGAYSPTELADYLEIDPSGVDAVSGGVTDPSPVLHLGVVDSQYENQGIGTRLMKARIRYARQMDADHVWGVSWQREGAKDSSVLFDRLGFTREAIVDDYYQGDRETCPDCESTCTCPGVIYRRRLSSQPSPTGETA